jgi:hypothetical protein
MVSVRFVFQEVTVEILILVGLMAVCIPAGIFVNHRRAIHRANANYSHRQFYSDGLMTQEIEALKLESSPPDEAG